VTAPPPPDAPPSGRRRRLVELDEADRRLIDALVVEGRMSNRALAGVVGLSEATVAARIRSLQDRRVLGISAVFDWEAAGYRWDLRLAIVVEGRPVLEVADAIAALDGVHWVMLVFGSADIVVHARCPDRAATIGLTSQVASVRGARSVTTDVNIQTLKYEVRFARVPVAPTPLRFPDPVLPLDALDHAIIGVLVGNGRQSNREVARQAGTSEGTVRLRLRRLVDAGLLRICGQTDPYRTGRVGSWAYLDIDVAGGEVHNVADELRAMPEILVLTCTSGRHALWALAVASHRAELVEVILGRIQALPEVRATTTSEVVRTVKLDYHWGRFL
jgi:DNA-binding Lrp family transcriptional regulator